MNNPTHLLTISPQFSPLSIIRALWKRKLFILTCAIVGTGATVLGVSRLAPVYTANAVILVESQKIPESFVAATVQTALEAQMDTLKQQVLSRDRLWGLVESFDLYPDERRRLTKEEVFQLMRSDITISLSRGWSTSGPGAFQVEYQARKAETAAAVANRIGRFFIDENLRQRTDEAVATSKFLDEQLAAAETRLREQENKLKEFKLIHNGELPQQEAALLAAVNQSRAELLGIQQGLGRAQQSKLILESSLAYAEANLRQRREMLRQQAAARASASPVPSVNPTPPAPSPLEIAENELRRLRTRYHDSHLEVQRMMAEVQRLKQEQAQQAVIADSGRPVPTGASATSTTTTDPEPARLTDEEAENNRIQELRAQISVVKEEIRGLEERQQQVLKGVAEAQMRILNLPVREQQMAVITRDYETSRNNYQSLLNKKLAADVATDMERWHKSQKFVMLDSARVPQKPTRPRRTLLIASGTLLSLALGAGLGFLREWRKNAILGEWELPSGIVVIGRLPHMKMQKV